jgi:hypothetical protein
MGGFARASHWRKKTTVRKIQQAHGSVEKNSFATFRQ